MSLTLGLHFSVWLGNAVFLGDSAWGGNVKILKFDCGLHTTTDFYVV